jgi:hypothetical protein
MTFRRPLTRMMLRLGPSLVLALLLLAMPCAVLAQTGNVAQAQRLAEQLGQQGELPVNVRLRFQVLHDLIPALSGEGDAGSILTFFSTTRILVWNRPLSPQTGQMMRDFEGQMVALARGKSFNLDLPPVGYSTAGAAGGAAPPMASPPSSGPLLVNRSTREGLLEATLRAEEMGTAALSRNASPPLQALRDSLTVLRQDLADDQVSSDAVRNVLLARVAFLASPASSGADPAFMEKLDAATEALRTNFPPELLRRSRGQMVSI